MAIWIDGVANTDVYSCFKNINYNLSNNIYYTWDNWVKEIRSEPASFAYTFAINDKINMIKFRGGAIWLTANGEICYRFSPFGKVHTASIAKINLVFSNFLDCNFNITQTVPIVTSLNEEIARLQDENKLTISVAQLLLVEAEEFNPYVEKEFYQNQSDGLIYRNTFKPSFFLQLSPPVSQKVNVEGYSISSIDGSKDFTTTVIRNELKKSITLQYLYYLCNYKEDRFFWLIDWLASFFKNLSNRSENIFVLYGNKHSGIDIFFQYIITPLFGEEYSLSITENTLEIKNTKEKLFYNLKNFSKKAIENVKVAASLQKLLLENQKYAQVLITTEEPIIPFSNIDNYTVFYVSTAITEMYIPNWFNRSDKTKLTQQQLIDAIASDLENFANILKLYPSNTIKSLSSQNDDKKLLLNTLEDKLKTFVDAVKRMDIIYFKSIQQHNLELYNELQEHFDKQLIKQSNLKEYFNILYPDEKFESSRTFMKKLRDIDDLFQTQNVKPYTAGKKYFKIPN